MKGAGRRIEEALAAAIGGARGGASPPKLAAALSHAVFPGGKRLRPRLVLAVAAACGLESEALARPAAVAIELLHCASLVHDDLPCFDNSPLRRGQPSVHTAFGERIAVLAGDALIVLAFEVLALARLRTPQTTGQLVAVIAQAVGAPRGIAAGQAWECEAAIDLEAYHRAKTGALFSGAAAAGALSAGHEPTAWHLFGDRLGLAFQTADDLCDALGAEADLGKPTGRDAVLGRPNAVAQSGAAGALVRVTQLLDEALEAVPSCPGQDQFRALVLRETQRLLPPGVARAAA